MGTNPFGLLLDIFSGIVTFRKETRSNETPLRRRIAT